MCSIILSLSRGTPDLRDPPGVFPDPPGLSRGSPISSSPVSFARRVARAMARTIYEQKRFSQGGPVLYLCVFFD